MTVSTENLVQVQTALRQMPEGDLAVTATGLMDLLGYQSDRIPLGQTGQAADFVGQFRAENPGTKTEKEFLSHDPIVQVLSQVTDTEIDLTSQPQLIRQDRYDPANIRSFVFASVDLKGDTYPRGKYAQFAREVNKRMSQPTVVLFRTASGKLTFAFMKRRPDKRDGNRDVLGKVSLIREIDTRSPHPAHVRIVAELALDDRLGWMKSRNKQPNFEGLLEAWLDTLDIEALNKQFYRKLFAWFENAVDEARFPTSENPTREEHIIRLITRLLFIWFIKEKQLVHADLFNEEQIRPLLEGYDRDTGDSYYRAVLQNLFFATLNTEIDQRGFNDTGADSDFSRYHYQREIADPERLRSLFDETPFINGGLFDCLDNPTTGDGGGLIDCFTDKSAHRDLLSVPNRLFFGPDGLIDLFDDYRFTVEENTPIEQDVALDPELLGKVFENLLAAFNPETRESARKQTGSYYTPRQVVDYMVTEALVAYWKEAVPDDHDAKGFWEERLRYLLDYTEDIDDAGSIFEASEQERLIENIAHIKMLDPAVGSGAYPMALLHRITLALTRLDPDNTAWKATQQRLATSRAGQAFGIEDKDEREGVLLGINEAFERYRSGFGRKLYLIQNSIYGVDIQPIACQISKLRMFISLAIEQQPDNDRDNNYGIRPLPNLESKFVAADTLIGLKGQERLASSRAVDLREKWAANTEQHFHATTREQKEALVGEDRRLRFELANELRNLGMSPDHTDRIADWDRYDQNATADWFDPKYMFNTPDGFDIVIGNPPYISLARNRGQLANKYQSARYDAFTRSGDIYTLFYERGCQLLKPEQGALAYITSNSWMKAQYGKKLRQYITDQHTPSVLLEMGKDVFDAVVDTNIVLLREGGQSDAFPAIDMDSQMESGFTPHDGSWGQIRPAGKDPWIILSPIEKRVLDKMENRGTRLDQWEIRIHSGIKTGYNAAFIVDQPTRDRLVAEDPRSAEIIKPMMRGKDMNRYVAEWAGWWLIYSHSGVAEDDYPAIRKHLIPHKIELLARRGGANPRTGQVPYEWWQLQADYYSAHLSQLRQEEAALDGFIPGGKILILRNRNLLSEHSLRNDRKSTEVPPSNSKQFPNDLVRPAHFPYYGNGADSVDRFRCEASADTRGSPHRAATVYCFG